MIPPARRFALLFSLALAGCGGDEPHEAADMGSARVDVATPDAGGEDATPAPDATTNATTAMDDEFTMLEDTIELLDVLANDDPGLTLLDVDTVDHVALAIDGDAISATPSPGYDGMVGFTYGVRDSDGATSRANVALTIEGVDDPPTAMDDQLAAAAGSTATVDLLVNDRDPEGSPLTALLLDSPRHGTLDLVDGVVSYTAAPDFNGYERVRYRISDAGGATAEAALHITSFDTLMPGAPTVIVEPPGLRPEDLAVVVNDSDPYSVAVGAYYAIARGLPAENVVHVDFATGADVMDPGEFTALKSAIDAATPADVQAYALAWIAPYRVNCMSMTSAIALGYDEQYCGIGAGCQASAPVSYFGSFSDRPFDDHTVRPAMMLAMTDESGGTALVDRGVAADATFPTATGYLVRTTDTARSVRFGDFAGLPSRWAFPNGLDLLYVDNSDGSGSNTITDVDDVMFYFTGLTTVGGLDTLTFLPGAAADHLTSFGGRLTSISGQMSAVRWLEAGATGSFGTVVEPCNFQQKFPRVSTFLDHYYRGETLIEAYWKSVNWPGEGVFIGEPLSRPYGRVFLTFDGTTLSLGTSWLAPNVDYEIAGSDDPAGSFERVGDVVRRGQVGFEEISIVEPTYGYYVVRVVE